MGIDINEFIDSLESKDEEYIDLSLITDYEEEIYDYNGELLDGLDNLSNEKIIALGIFLELKPLEANDEIAEEGGDMFTYGNQEYVIATDSEADQIERDYIESLIENILYEIKRDYPNIVKYIDEESMMDDYSENRGRNIASYDGYENEEKVNDTYYYIYRIN